MFKLRKMTVAWLIVASVVAVSGRSPAELLKGAERKVFVDSAAKGCVGTHGKGQNAAMARPVFEQYCACVANGVADRVPKAELMKEGDQSDWMKDNEAAVDEIVAGCAPKEESRELFVAGATKGCVGTYGQGKKSAAIAKPRFEQYCTCVANGMADRIPMGDLIKGFQNETPDFSKENQAKIDEEVTRCLQKVADRKYYVTSATAACVATHGNGRSAVMAKPIFEQYCACVANGVVDRVPIADLIKADMSTDDQKSGLSKENQAVAEEEARRCLPDSAGRELFVANVTKGCSGIYGQDKKSPKISRPLFEQYCGCVAKGVAARLPIRDLISESENLSKESETIFDEEVARCGAAIAESAQQGSSGHK
jgi:hypothetical protein